MKSRHYISSLVCIAAVFMLVSTVNALIKVEWTVEKLYGTSKTVVTGKVIDTVADSHVVNVNLTQTLKGKSPGPNIRVQFAPPVEMPADIAAGQPLVFFLADAQGAGGAVVHINDTWLLATGVPNSNIWRIVKVDDTVKQSFPGRTSALVKMVTDLNAGTSTFMDKFEHKPFNGGIHKRAKLPIQKATWMLAEDVNGDKKPDLLIGTAAGTQLFIAKGDGYEDATEAWGLKGVAGKFHAVGDVNGDGKPDLLLDNTIYINDGQKFVASKATLEIGKGAPLAAALIDATGDKKPDAVFLSADGELRVYENSGSTDKPWTLKPSKPLWSGGEAPTFAAFGDFGDTGKLHAMVISKSGIMRYALDADGGPPSDLIRLTGVDFKKLEKYKGEFKNPTAVTLSMNGEARPDLFIYSDAGSMLLLNRGLGTFFLDESASTTLTANGATPLPLTPSPATVWTRADLHGKGLDDVLLLGEDGTLYEIDNSPK